MPASELQDAELIVALEPTPRYGSGSDQKILRFASRKSLYLPPSSGGTPAVDNVKFDMLGMSSSWSSWANSYLSVPLVVSATTPLVGSPVSPIVAFKSSILSIFNRVVVKNATGGTLIDEKDPLTLAAHLRIALDKDEDWYKSGAADIHFGLDRPHPGVVGLTTKAQILSPNISKFMGGPTGGTASDSNNSENPAYNAGFHERQQCFVRSCYDHLGAAPVSWTNDLKLTARIPLRLLSDFLRSFCDSGPIINDRLQFEFYLAKDGYSSPLTLGSVVGVGAGNTPVAGAGLKVSFDTEPPRLYYEQVEMSPDLLEKVETDMVNGGMRTLTWRNYEVIPDFNGAKNLANGAKISHHLTTAGVAVRKIYAMCFPTGSLTTDDWPSVLVTGPNGLTGVNIHINNKKYFENTFDSVSDHYEALLDSAHIGLDSGDRECMIPYDLFKFTSRVNCYDISRYANLSDDPNGPIDVAVNATVAAAGPVDIVYVVESLMEGTKSLTKNGNWTWSIGAPAVKV